MWLGWGSCVKGSSMDTVASIVEDASGSRGSSMVLTTIIEVTVDMGGLASEIHEWQ